MHSLLLSHPYFNHAPSTPSSFAKANLYEKEDAYLIELEAPGYSKEDFKITATANAITVEATRSITVPEGFNLHRQESQAASLKREFRFRRGIDAESIQATATNGILSVNIPKRAVRLIEVQTA